MSKTCDAYLPPTDKPENSGFCDRCGMHDWRHAAPAVQPGTCDASMPGVFPLGPCVLRHGHAGPVHQEAGGAKWWPRTAAASDMREADRDTVKFTVDDRTPPRLISTGLLDEADAQPPLAPLLYDQIKAMFGVPLPPYVAPHRGSCPCGGGDFGGESIHAPGCPVHPVRLRAAEAAATALLPEEARAAGLHFEYERTELPPIISVLADGEDPDDVASAMQALAAEQFAFETWPTCTATWATFDGIAHCEERADHYPPGQVHLGRTPSGVSYQWIDEEDGATPHTDTTTED